MAVVFLLVILFPPSLALGDVFTSVGEFWSLLCVFAWQGYVNTLPVAGAGHMTDLLFTEKDLVTSLKEYIRAEEDKLAQIKQ